MRGIGGWPVGERPRERLLALGPGPLTDAELLAVCLGTGVRGRDALGVARDLLAGFGGVHALLRAPGEQARARPGLGPARWAALQAATELVRRSLQETLAGGDVLAQPDDVRRFLALWLRDRPHECFVGLFLDTQHRLIAAEELFRGTLAQTSVYPREVARRALALNAGALIVAHNHPSGLAEPSRADEWLTAALKAALAPLEVPLLDHLVVGGNRCTSLAERGIL